MRRLIALVAAMMVMVSVAVPASAQTAARNSCPNWIPRANFSDVGPENPHAFDIDCIAWLNITDRVGTFGPTENLPRWEMATWMTQAIGWVQWILVDIQPTFSDTGGLPPDVVDAIEFVRLVDVTKGVGDNTFAPYGAVTRWQMALFLTRLVSATGLALPDGADQGFNDIGGVSAEARLAINQLAQLGITTGTGPATFSPDTAVTRQQMASFVARTIEKVWVLFPVADCATPDEAICVGDFENEGIPMTPLRVRAAETAWPIPGVSLADALAYLNSLTAEISVNGIPQPLSRPKYLVERTGIAYAFWEIVIPAGTTGTVVVAVKFFENGQLTRTRIVNVTFR